MVKKHWIALSAAVSLFAAVVVTRPTAQTLSPGAVTQSPQLVPALGLPALTMPVIDPIPTLEFDGQIVRETLRVLDRTGKHVIEIPAGTQAKMNRGAIATGGGFDTGGFRQLNTAYALHAVAGPSIAPALMYSTNRDLPNLTGTLFTWSRRVSECMNDNTNRIVPFVQQGTQCLMLGSINGSPGPIELGLGGGSIVPGPVSVSKFMPRPEKNRVALLGTRLNTSGEAWNVHHGDFGGPIYLQIVGNAPSGMVHGPTFQIRVNAAGDCLFNLTSGSPSLSVQGLGFWLNLDN